MGSFSLRGGIGARSGSGLFSKQWTFGEQVEMGAARLIFRFEKSARTPGHFDAQLVLEDPVTGQRCDWSNSQYQPNDALDLGPHIVQNPMTIRSAWS